MKHDTRKYFQRVNAVRLMAELRGKPVTPGAAINAVSQRMWSAGIRPNGTLFKA